MLRNDKKSYNWCFLKIETMHLLFGQIFFFNWKCDVRKTHFHVRQVFRFVITMIRNILKFGLKEIYFIILCKLGAFAYGLLL